MSEKEKDSLAFVNVCVYIYIYFCVDWTRRKLIGECTCHCLLKLNFRWPWYGCSMVSFVLYLVHLVMVTVLVLLLVLVDAVILSFSFTRCDSACVIFFLFLARVGKWSKWPECILTAFKDRSSRESRKLPVTNHHPVRVFTTGDCFNHLLPLLYYMQVTWIYKCLLSCSKREKRETISGSLFHRRKWLQREKESETLTS